MKIAGTNYSVLSLKATNSLLSTQKAIARSLERLASGRRVSSPRDDAHAYVQGVGLTAQIRGLTQANFGINTGLGMVATAESAVSTQINIVQRMRELAVQAANGSLTNLQRSMLNEEVQTLLEEYNRITAQTDFNGRKLLDGSFTTINLQVGTNKGNSIGFTIGSTQASSVFVQRTTTGDGTFQARTTIAAGSNPRSVIATDVNGDEVLDLVTLDALSPSVSISLGNGDGTFQARTTIPTGTGPYSVVGADLNNDGNVDLMSVDNVGTTISISLGNGNGTFQARTTIETGTSPLFMNVADVDGDGNLDIMSADRTGDTVSISLGNGNGTFQARTTISTGLRPYSVLSTDLNGDGNIDLVTNDFNDNAISVYLGNGNGTFAARTSFAAGTAPYYSAATDFNGDGKIDIVTSDFTSGTASIFLGNGNGTFQARTTIATGAGPDFITTSDLNGDGNMDIISADRTDSTVSIALGNGNGTFQARTTLAIGAGPFAVITADLNDDGAPDIVTADNTNFTASIFLGNPTERSAAAAVSIATQEDAEAMLQVFDDAMAALSETQANLGSIHSRLDIAVASNLILSDNLVEARSKALDTDYATEVADLARNQILQDVGLAVLAQANLNQQLVLKLLDFDK